MKKVILISAIIAASFITAAPAQADNLTLRICEYVQANDKSRLRSFLKQNKLKIRKIYDGIQCNNDNLLIFAAKSQALEVGEFIIGKLPSKKVKLEIDNLAKHSAHLAEEARDR
ncbi:DUF3718 domain-containing protein [Colwellia psychrerythraea]|uniref:DUF3718 domain-containing protein n=1 Tax=Colwellia psychrerythraea TaxID=28229 RepID=A0A099L214_COLPS|nr:DUF3718 domain-containing protein [Colwellia psychrerythraea]KGJ96152.1 Protein of unknown function DUF3718 [Colwellia psychrerythraea]